MGTLVNNTYDAYQQGKINTTDLIDPYVLASERSPDSEFQGWAASQLTLLGQNSPSNFDTTGAFEVTTGNETYEGIVFSPQNPASGQFEANTTYDAANISGTQYLVTANRTRELTGTFTLGNITAKDGERVQNVTIEKTTYQTSNVTELKQLYEDLAYERAKIEAREQALRAAAGGGGLLGGSMNATAALVVVALVLALGIINN
ncbi:hypothetical protein EGH21_21380 [Halomicroarcula sp. F13]|uniref:Envelope protein N-terminal domain-containing protein n=1 Tax=Haloarcula rubra TaxID=2487747 RepID=A0AAW4PYG5_9EURY|nr:hypothetical protein [Halomicroarcula rubra]